MFPATLLIAALAATAQINHPAVLDNRLELQLVAAEPDIVTPTGLAVDYKGRVLAIESHTHFRPKDYDGPPADRILLFDDFDPVTGKARRRKIFYEGTTHTMSLAVFYDGSVYVATRMEIFRLRDKDGDGTADERTGICRLETTGNYPHNGLSGITFDYAGNVFFGFGENLGAPYKLIGSDGTTLSGGGEGGNIYCCDSEGRHLRRVATGFWNPFHMTFDAFGRLFAVDNDPDSRPPCRLLHIVEGGDYGFRFRNGRKGVHPFTAWNGELPGTLPMVSGTGEAPCAVLAYESDNLPQDYLGDLLVTSWGDHRLERYTLKPQGASFTATMTPVVRGDQNFRPVGLALAPDGSLFMSDWVDKSYPLHGKGRIWRLSAKKPGPRTGRPGLRYQLSSPHGPTRTRAIWNGKDNPWPSEVLGQLGSSQEPRLRVIAAMANLTPSLLSNTDPLKPTRALALYLNLGPPEDFVVGVFSYPSAPGVLGANRLPPLASRADPVAKLLNDDSPPAAKAAALRYLTQLTPPELARFKGKALSANNDADAFVRQAAILGQMEGLASTTIPAFESLKPGQRLAVALAKRRHSQASHQMFIPTLLSDPDPNVQLVGIMWVGEEIIPEYLPLVEELLATRATTRTLFQACLATIHEIKGGPSGPQAGAAGDAYVLKALLNEKSSPAVRRFALRTISPQYPEFTDDRLTALLADPDAQIRLEALRTMRERPDHRWPELRQIAADSTRNIDERCEAILGLNPERPADRDLLLSLSQSESTEVATEARRMLRGVELTETQKKALGSSAGLLSEQGPPSKDDAAWLALAQGEANPAAGERLFFHSRLAMCSRCHEYEGRGSRIGPDLSTIGRTLTRERLLQSIIDPSREIAPQFTTYTILTHAGDVLIGLHTGDEIDGCIRFADPGGQTFHVNPNDIDRQQPSPQSLMPQNLAGQLTPQELRDLLAFLMKQ